MRSCKKFFLNNPWKIVAILVLGLLAKNTDFEKILEALATADLNFIILAILPSLLNILMWSIAWKKMFSLTGFNFELRNMLRVYTSSRFVNLVTPLGHFGGAPIMAIVVSENTESNYGTAISAILTSNILVSFPLFLSATSGYVYLYYTNGLTTQMSKLFFGLLFIIAIGTFSLMLGLISPNKFKKLVNLVLTPINFVDKTFGFLDINSKLRNFEDNVLNAFEDLRGNYRSISYSAVVISIAFVFRIFSLYIILKSLDIGISVFVIALIIPLSSLANYGPTPGGTGFVESAIVGLLLLFSSTSTSSALVAAIIYRITTYYLEISIGYITMSTLDSKNFRNKIERKQH